ncbi:MAG TPA: 50S ribosomal protein L19 [Candidatus Paceibacterota bacterium]|nr:50S ribosomal protein L19 [Candidatus Paceibacterota bacterium]
MDQKIMEKIRPGAKVKVYTTVAASASKEVKKGKADKAAAAREGTSVFEGLVLARKHGKEAGATFTVRAVLAGVGVEKVFPFNSPSISKVEIVNSPKKIHTSKLYWVRKASSSKMRQRLGTSV